MGPRRHREFGQDGRIWDFKKFLETSPPAREVTTEQK